MVGSCNGSLAPSMYQGRRRRSGRSGEGPFFWPNIYAIRRITFLPFQPLLSCLPVI